MARYFLFTIPLAALLVVPSSQACGPFFPNGYLTYGLEAQVLSLPEASFYHELSVVLGQAPEIENLWRPNEGDSWAKTLDADMDDLRSALTANGTDGDTSERLVREYSAMRDAMNAGAPLPSAAAVLKGSGEDALSANSSAAAQSDSVAQAPGATFRIADYEDLLSALPAEFSAYVRGAAAYRAQNFDGAMDEWRNLLAMPAAERAYRSTWAAYMLGKSLLIKEDYEGALAAFAQVRDLAAAGFKDSLALGPDSLGWQAAIEAGLGDTVSAMHHYVDMFLNGPKETRNTGYTSLRWMCTRAMGEPETFNAFAADPVCRGVITAWVVANRYEMNNSQWLDAVSAMKLQGPVAGGDRLAWAAYNAGDMDGARQWLALTDPTSPYSRWVQSKLLLRDGKIDEAVALLREVTRSFPVDDRWVIGWYEPETAPRDIANAELGVLLLGRKDYVNALDCLLRSGYWIDAAYVAERVLTLDELRSYVAAHTQDAELAQPLSPTEYWQEEEHTRFELLRELLARRLARAGQWDSGFPYYAEEERGIAEELKTHLVTADVPLQQKGWGASISDFVSGLWGSKPEHVIDTGRAEAYFEAGEITRNNGMELTGTEVEPDWYLFGGNFELGGATEGRLAGEMHTEQSLNDALASALAAADDEKQRAASSAPTPNKRFHYRYIAADLMWQSAEWLPNNDLRTERALYWGGVYLKDRDPQTADRFYKALVWRNLNMPYAQAADKKRWFPAEPPDDWKPESDR